MYAKKRASHANGIFFILHSFVVVFMVMDYPNINVFCAKANSS